jgi:hypothetical protein
MTLSRNLYYQKMITVISETQKKRGFVGESVLNARIDKRSLGTDTVALPQTAYIEGHPSKSADYHIQDT